MPEHTGIGGFVLVGGPSGAGKDSLINFARSALAGDPRFVFPERVVTRPSSAYEQHQTMDEASFAEAERSGAFAVSWRAHGLGYALPRSVLEAAHGGSVVICNVSRGVVPWCRLNFPGVLAVEITAPPEVLAARLAGRNRAEDGDLAKRLSRSAEICSVKPDRTIVNDGALEDAGRELTDVITQHAAALNQRPVPNPLHLSGAS
jgi:ribose 1,5-bisphosphokinase